MTTSSNGNIFRVTIHLGGEFPHEGQWRGALMFYLICIWINGWVNNREAGDLRRHHAHYDITQMMTDVLNIQLILHQTKSIFEIRAANPTVIGDIERVIYKTINKSFSDYGC